MRKTLEERFWEKVDISGDCWNWQGSTYGGGYGTLKVGGRAVGAHRVSYWLVHGHIPDELNVCHHCDNPLCVKPSHLFMGTQSDNMKDSFAKGRLDNQGEENGNSKLVENDVHEIRRLYILGVKDALLGKMWTISRMQIRRIVRGINWRHI